MATDSFTNTNGTELSTHTAGGITWAGMVFGEALGQINSNRVDCGGGFNITARASGLTGDFSQIVFKAGAYGAESKGVHVRASASRYGYRIMCFDAPTGNNFTQLALIKDEAWISGANVTMDRTADHTIAIRATTVGSNVEIRGYLDGTPLTWLFTLPDFEGDAGTVYLDNDTAILSGNPGFSFLFNGDITQANSAFDDFTDTESGGGGSTTVNPTTGALTMQGRTPAGNVFTNVRYQEVLINAAGSPMSNRTGQHFVIWYGGKPSGAPDLSYSDMTTGAAGTASYSLATGPLVLGQKVFGVITDGGATSLSSFTCGLLTLTYS